MTPPSDVTDLRLSVGAGQRARPILRWQAALELLFIALCLLVAARHLLDFDPALKPFGIEISYLVNSGAIAGDLFRETGAIPLWNPLLGDGEPLVEGPFSFILNPFMFLPFLPFDATNATKIAILIHLLLMGVGGWALGLALNLRAPGRILLALLLGGSGSMAAATLQFQMGLSQAYVPWVYAGLIGVVTRKSRAWVGLLIVSAYLLLTAGTLWFVLPTALSCVLLCVLLLIGQPRAYIKSALLRLGWASLLVVGLAASRLLPLWMHRDLFWHPPANFRDAQTIPWLLERFFDPTPQRYQYLNVIHYHYLLPPAFAVFIVMARLAFLRSPAMLKGRWRIFLAAIVLVALFIGWAQADNGVVRWFYARLPILDQWRLLGRMQAAATPWLAVLIAVCFDDVLHGLLAVVGVDKPALPQQSRYRANPLTTLTIITILLLAGWAMRSTLTNWQRVNGLQSLHRFNQEPLTGLREEKPAGFFAVYTWTFDDYFPFYDLRVRASLGNPDYRALGITPTIGGWEPLDFDPAYAILTFDAIQAHYVDELGYSLYDLSADRDGGLVYYNDNRPTYALLVNTQTLIGRTVALGKPDTLPVTTFSHHFDTVRVTLPRNYQADTVLVIREAARPEWQVTVNSTRYPLQSIGGMAGVLLPPVESVSTPGPLQIVFHYLPVWYQRGATLTILTALILCLYLLRVMAGFTEKVLAWV